MKDRRTRSSPDTSRHPGWSYVRGDGRGSAGRGLRDRRSSWRMADASSNRETSTRPKPRQAGGRACPGERHDSPVPRQGAHGRTEVRDAAPEFTEALRLDANKSALGLQNRREAQDNLGLAYAFTRSYAAAGRSTRRRSRRTPITRPSATICVRVRAVRGQEGGSHRLEGGRGCRLAVQPRPHSLLDPS